MWDTQAWKWMIWSLSCYQTVRDMLDTELGKLIQYKYHYFCLKYLGSVSIVNLPYSRKIFNTTGIKGARRFQALWKDNLLTWLLVSFSVQTSGFLCYRWEVQRDNVKHYIESCPFLRRMIHCAHSFVLLTIKGLDTFTSC